MNRLNITLKKQWFDMIAAGAYLPPPHAKMEEYREIKDYWIKRLALCKGDTPVPHGYHCKKASCMSCVTRGDGFKPQHFDEVIARNGYAKDAPFLRFVPGEIRIGKPNPLWCPPETDLSKDVFIIPVAELLEIEYNK